MLRFTIRNLLWLMVVVGLGIALAFEHRKQVHCALTLRPNRLLQPATILA
jgi:hypothetical protein